MLDNLVNQLKLQTGIEALPVQDEKGLFGLKVKDLSILMFDLNPGVYFFSEIAKMPDEGKEDLLILLMRANFIEQGTGGGIIGLNTSETLFTFSRTHSEDLTYQTFHDILEEFLNYSFYWQEVIRTPRESIL